MARMARRYFVSGRVQGVFFRASTREQAVRLSITGHAKNLADGRVEVLAMGEAESLDILGQWLSQGPPAASVTEVVMLDAEVDVDANQRFITL